MAMAEQATATGPRTFSSDKPVVLVTGGAQGIGQGVAGELLARGWRVVICDVDETAATAFASQSESSELLALEADVASESDVARVIRETVAWGGRLDALVNNAGIADPFSGSIETLALADWQRRIDVNLTGAFLTAKHAVPHLRKAGGAIVNMASTRALQSEPDCEAYAASKGGLVALTHALAVSLGPDVRVNAVSPGWIDVRGQQTGAPDALEPLSDADHRQHPVGRVGHAGDIAAAVAYLISSEAGFVTGQNLVIDGGMTRRMIYEE